VKVKTEVREFVASHYLPDAPAESITDAMPLITSGIVDSIGMLALVDFIESRYAVEFMPREIDVYALDTVERIEALIHAKQSQCKVAASQNQTCAPVSSPPKN
jgi:acyl carrier protein